MYLALFSRALRDLTDPSDIFEVTQGPATSESGLSRDCIAYGRDIMENSDARRLEGTAVEANRRNGGPNNSQEFLFLEMNAYLR